MNKYILTEYIIHSREFLDHVMPLINILTTKEKSKLFYFDIKSIYGFSDIELVGWNQCNKTIIIICYT